MKFIDPVQFCVPMEPEGHTLSFEDIRTVQLCAPLEGDLSNYYQSEACL